MPHTVYAVEGLDRLGKSTLIQGIQDKFGYYQVIHFAKPQKLRIYEEAAKSKPHQGDGPIWDAFHNEDGSRALNDEAYQVSRSAFHYQSESFRNSMLLAQSGARIIFDRWHIGEAVYSPIYRGYSGNYVFDQERSYKFDQLQKYHIRLILLIEDFYTSKHFMNDGKSLGPTRNRPLEHNLFLDAFNKSLIKDKRIVCVTARDGGFRPKEEILEEALS